MKNAMLMALLGVICCNNSDKTVAEKKYSPNHTEALTFCKSNNYNTDYYFLIDMSLHSGKNRFFVYSFKESKITDKKLVTHGSCDQFEANPDKWVKAKFNVKNNSHCSMLGKYKIGNRDYSGWGINVKYWLEGLETTNKTARERIVVLHSWKAVSDSEVFPKYSPLSWGCPAVSDEFMKVLDKKLQVSKKPVLLWIIE